MKKFILIFFVAAFATCFTGFNALCAQDNPDTTMVQALIRKADSYRFMKPDSFLPTAEKALAMARQINYRKGIGLSHNTIGEFHRVSGNYPVALENFSQALVIAREIGDKRVEAQAIGFMGITYTALGEYQKGVHYLKQAIQVMAGIKFDAGMVFFFSNIGDAYEKMSLNDSALFFHRSALERAKQITMKPAQAYVLGKMGVLQAKLKQYDSAFHYLDLALEKSTADVLNKARIHFYLAEIYATLKNNDSTRKYARLAIKDGYISNQRSTILEAADILYKTFQETGPIDSALKYLQLNSGLKDSLFGREKFKMLQILAINEQENKFLAEKQQHELQVQLEKSQIRSKSRYRTIAFSVTLLFVGLLAFFVWRNLKRQKKVNLMLRSQQEKISAQNAELEKTLNELKSTQSQLIQSEKMASLGELTAGIAHEIQNPLNFVNNFSDVNAELIDELKEQIAIGNLQQAKEISENIKANEAKIILHGKRADAIVKSMLQHSRTSSGKKEPTDINAVVDEFLRLSYHGLRAKDKTFNANFETKLDPAVGKLEIASQEIGRVLLNLINNAFYAVGAKRKALPNENYDPTVTIQTKREKDKIIIVVKDNGNGIPKAIVEKIFQPFFTTKPAGEGTGLGLSLAYDTIVNGHRGNLEVQTEEGEGTSFIISLPIE